MSSLSTHALATSGAVGSVGALPSVIGGTITLPAFGPWIIHHVWVHAAFDNTAEVSGLHGYMKVDSYSGDITPDPAPGLYPVTVKNISVDPRLEIISSQILIYPVLWKAPGKAQIQLMYASTAAPSQVPRIHAGIIFGPTPPTPGPFVFSDVVYTSFTNAGVVPVGTITLSEKATRIVGVYGDVAIHTTATANSCSFYRLRLESDDVELLPSSYPCVRGYHGYELNSYDVGPNPTLCFLDVSIHVPGGARIDCYIEQVVPDNSTKRGIVAIAYI
jgi:hypothetical protein